MRVSDAQLKVLIDHLDSRKGVPPHFPFPICSAGQLARDLMDARATLAQRDEHIKELELEVKSNAALVFALRRGWEVAAASGFANQDAMGLALSMRPTDALAELKTQLATAKREGAAEELERMAGKFGSQYVGTRRFTASDLLDRAAALRGEVGK